jgi:prepilin-type processing-associated H-X9-DG protein
VSADRLAVLERCGRLYGELRLAIAWTVTNAATGPDDTRPKQVTTKGWPHTKPLPDPGYAAGMFKRGLKRNPVLVLGTASNVVGIEVDTEEGLARVEALGLPATVSVCSSKPHKRHYWFRPPPELEQLPFVAFRFEPAGLRADRERYLLAPPSLHPSGATYSFVDGHAPDELEIAVMPIDVYRRLVDEHEAERGTERTALELDPGAKVLAGHRRETVFRFACMQRRWSSSREVILAASLAWNAAHCEPPLTADQVAGQVDGAMKMHGGQELAGNATANGPAPRAAVAAPALDEVVATFRRHLHFPDPTPIWVVLAAEVANRIEEGDPVWLMLIAGSSRGKTELLAALAGLRHVRFVGAMTEAALLSGTPHRERKQDARGGLLREIPSRGALLVVKDMGAILSMQSDRRASVLQALRDVYDGRYVRDVGTGGGERLEWTGRVGLIGGATGELDRHHAVLSALGERWVTLRLGDETAAAIGHASLRDFRTATMRDQLSQVTARYLAALNPPEMRALDQADEDLLVDVATLATTARSAVIRERYSREIELVPQTEAPARLARQLHKLLLSLDAIGLDHGDARAAIARVGLDSIPSPRREALELLLDATGALTTAQIATRLALPTKTTSRTLEELTALHLSVRRKAGEGDTAPNMWSATSAAIALWDTVCAWSAKTPTPPSKERESRRERIAVQASLPGAAGDSEVDEPPLFGVDEDEIERLAELARQLEEEGF